MAELLRIFFTFNLLCISNIFAKCLRCMFCVIAHNNLMVSCFKFKCSEIHDQVFSLIFFFGLQLGFFLLTRRGHSCHTFFILLELCPRLKQLMVIECFAQIQLQNKQMGSDISLLSPNCRLKECWVLKIESF